MAIGVGSSIFLIFDGFSLFEKNGSANPERTHDIIYHDADRVGQII